MARRSNKSVQDILGNNREFISFGLENELDKKITLATEGFTTQKHCELTLRDRTRLSKENALTVSDYIIDMKREINPRLNTIRTTISILSKLSKAVGIEKSFINITRDDILLSFLDRCRKSENKDPMHKWINTYNTKRQVLLRFFKWLQYRNVSGDPKKRDKLSATDREPKCIQDIPRLKRKEISSYKPSDVWDPEDDILFLKYVTNKRDRCYHAMSRDTSGRPHELLALKIKDIMFKTVDKYQYAEVLLNGKTGSRQALLTQSIPYIKEWLSDHPSRNNPNCHIFVSLNKAYASYGRRALTSNDVYCIYRDYKNEFFQALLEDPTIPASDKDKIKDLLVKPWNPYVRRHTGLTEKSKLLKDSTLRQYGGWSANSNMPRIYTHYFGNESCESLLESYGIIPKNSSGSFDLLSPKLCYNCNEGNTADAKFCSKCKMVLTYDAYTESLEKQQEKDKQIDKLSEHIARLESKYDNLSKQYLIDIQENNNRAKINTEITRLEADAYKKEKDIMNQTAKQILQLAGAQSENKPTERSAIDALNVIKSMLTEINSMRNEMAQNINEKNERLKKSIDRQTWILDDNEGQPSVNG